MGINANLLMESINWFKYQLIMSYVSENVMDIGGKDIVVMEFDANLVIITKIHKIEQSYKLLKDSFMLAQTNNLNYLKFCNMHDLFIFSLFFYYFLSLNFD